MNGQSAWFTPRMIVPVGHWDSVCWCYKEKNAVISEDVMHQLIQWPRPEIGG